MENKQISYFEFIKFKVKRFLWIFVEYFFYGLSVTIGGMTAIKLFFD